MSDIDRLEALLCSAFGVVEQLELIDLPAETRDEVRRLYEAASAADEEVQPHIEALVGPLPKGREAETIIACMEGGNPAAHNTAHELRAALDEAYAVIKKQARMLRLS